MGLLGRGKHLISNDALRGVLERHLPYERLEQTEVPVHVVTTELRSGRAIVLSSGPAVPALLASCAIPGVFPPVAVGRRELVDGGVANHTPISTAYESGARVIYVLPIGYPWLFEEPSNALGMALQALARLVEQRLEADIEKYRDVADIRVIQAVDAIPVSPADFSHSAELIERGYASARRLVRVESEKARAGATLKVKGAEAAA
jgi:NTE family protein